MGKRFFSVAEKVAHDNATTGGARYLSPDEIAAAHASKSVELAPGIFLRGRYANRHGLIAGATGSGKTVTLQTLAEGFSKIGVPVFLADVKGDIAGLATGPSPVQFLDCYGKQGSPLRISIAAMGPAMLSRTLGLSDVQALVVDIAFAYATATGARLESIKDFRKILGQMLAQREMISATLGQVSPASIGVIQRALLRLSSAVSVFEPPGFDPASLIETRDGKGLISILAADELIKTPDVYATVLLWLLSDLFDRMPEVGDLDRPRLVFIFDESHLLFDNCPPALLQRIEQIIRLVRSKGVGVYFATQSPADIPSTVAGQLANRVQHALRAATGKDAKEIRAAAETLPRNPRLDAAELIATMAPGQALVSFVGANGTPQPCELARVNLPACALGAISTEKRAEHFAPVSVARSARPISWGLYLQGLLALAAGWAGGLLILSALGAAAFYGARALWRMLF